MHSLQHKANRQAVPKQTLCFSPQISTQVLSIHHRDVSKVTSIATPQAFANRSQLLEFLGKAEWTHILFQCRLHGGGQEAGAAQQEGTVPCGVGPQEINRSLAVRSDPPPGFPSGQAPS